MKFLADQDVFHITIEWLRKKGHDVVTAKKLGMDRAADEELLLKAKEMDRLFLTRDKDFGALVFLKSEASPGVVLLRVSPVVLYAVHQELERIFAEHKKEELKGLFCVVEHHRYRIRHLPRGSR